MDRHKVDASAAWQKRQEAVEKGEASGTSFCFSRLPGMRGLAEHNGLRLSSSRGCAFTKPSPMFGIVFTPFHFALNVFCPSISEEAGI